MTYTLFSRLFREADNYNDVEMYIAERGWQDWMEPYSPTEISDILELIFSLSKSSFRELREKLGISRAELVRRYDFPSRTIQDWEYENFVPASHIKSLYVFAIYSDLREGKEGNNEPEESN